MGELGKLYDLQDDSVKEVNTKHILGTAQCTRNF